jgi:ribosomal protein S18 acetylase RimI-like enzyme
MQSMNEMTKPLQIMACDADDMIKAIELLTQSAAKYFFHEMSAEAQAVFLHENTLAAASVLQSKGFVYLAAKRDSQFLGFISYSQQGYIHQLFVNDDAQQAGIGSALLAAVQAQLQAENQVAVLTVSASNNAASFYLHHGFVATDSTQSWHGIPYNPMEKYLD